MNQYSNITILVVDDEEQLKETVIMHLELEGFNVLSACNGKEALEVLENNHVDFVLSDIKMPELDGMELTVEIRKKYKEVPVVLLVTGFSKYSEKQALENGALGLVEKPFDMDKIIEMIKQSQKIS
ncbi:MAG: response regulator [Halobacteriovoraceae bacterium]|nr:response regulator [Halobacteriovoraceae bacterium]